MNRSEYISDEDWEKFKAFSDKLETPCVVIRLDVIRRKYLELIRLMPFAKIYYAVKSNPAIPVITLLRDLGSCFDIASIYELNKLLDIGVSPDRISYGNTIKKEKDIRYAYEKGIRLFVTDSYADMINIANEAPGSRIFIRILMESSQTADWPLSRKFGCHPDMAYDLIFKAAKMGLEPYGVSFHVGSQQRDVGMWDEAISKVKYLFRELEHEKGIKLKMINMGGGLPGNYHYQTLPVSDYAAEITRYLEEDFGDNIPEIIMEPGRSLVADAGISISEVVLISKKTANALYRWVYLDMGKFNGLIETLDEAIKYPIFTEKDQEQVGPVVLAGPTCDSMDIMYENHKYELPLDVTIGDRVYWLSTGAYTSSYASVEFNGFPPLKTYFME